MGVASCALALLVVSIAGGQAPDPTLLVLQPADIAGTEWSLIRAPQLTTDDRVAGKFKL